MFVVHPVSGIRAQIACPGDKSIAHRSIFLSSLSPSVTRIQNFPFNRDCLETVAVFRCLGVRISLDRASGQALVHGRGPAGLRPVRRLMVKESGTTFRLLAGVLAGQPFSACLCAGPVLAQRPMRRITVPLRRMGAQIKAKVKSRKGKVEEFAPLFIRGKRLKPLTYTLAVASAQVKSALLLAALSARGACLVRERVPTRDHTERMLRLFKADIRRTANGLLLRPGKQLVSPGTIVIPADISSASFFIVLGLLAAHSRIVLKGVSLNPARTGVLRVLKRMGASIRIAKHPGIRIPGSEPIGDITVCSSRLRATRIRKEEVASVIDELPILMVAAAYARGRSVFEAVQELRVKETDRILSMQENLSRLGADVAVYSRNQREDVVITGTKSLRGAKVRSFGDHRTAMSMVIAGLVASGTTVIDDTRCISKSFPGFISLIKSLKS